MNARRLVAVVLSVLAAAPVGAARAADGPAGVPCAAATVTRYPGTVAVLYGGPVAGDGTLTCTVQLGGSRHSDPDDAVRSETGSGAVVVPPSLVVIPATAAEQYVCTAFTPTGGSPLYWTGMYWTTDADAPCVALRDVVGPVIDLAIFLVQLVCNPDYCDPIPLPNVDAILCPLLYTLAPGAPPLLEIRWDGDVYLAGGYVWDCPPYGN